MSTVLRTEPGTPEPTAPVPASPEPATAPAAGAHLSFTGVMRGEWIKLLSLRSTWWVLALAVALMTLFALGQSMSLDMLADSPEAAALGMIHGAEIVSGGYPLGMVTIAVLGALLITGEYSTGMIRSSLTAVPTRWPVLAAKAIALVVLTVVTSVLSLLLSSVVARSLLAGHDLVPALDDPQTWQIYGGVTYVLVVAALFALGIGTLVRSTAATVTIALTVLLLLPGFLGFITLDWVEAIVAHLPMPAAAAFVTVSDSTLTDSSDLTAWTGVLVVAAYAVVPLLAGAVVLRRRDA
ncbi:ABC-2 type transport system permease protein [Georgenia satyanarayanai]|uniref:ABC-2 type transport system permease protein n=1 Tax=Georgenia satyanarayanai TaxID=860221 RepID=A0A2Y9AVX0_9MICO|nr:ABC transporter permease subunit [Georgenia satyanarayanai]PYF97223.1 ABC-2 type transport system permease protein [Georgenia satyanarayanai]SSA46309.1 ABC-2 type transport system permease protein [Georgenia satyanarayanai]